MFSLSFLFLMEQGCGGPRRSGKSIVMLRVKEIVTLTKLMRMVVTYFDIYIYPLFIYLFIYLFIHSSIIFLTTEI